MALTGYGPWDAATKWKSMRLLNGARIFKSSSTCVVYLLEDNENNLNNHDKKRRHVKFTLRWKQGRSKLEEAASRPGPCQKSFDWPMSPETAAAPGAASELRSWLKTAKQLKSTSGDNSDQTNISKPWNWGTNAGSDKSREIESWAIRILETALLLVSQSLDNETL